MYTSSLAKTASALLSSGIIPQSAPVPPTSAQRCGHCPAAVSPFAVPELVEAKERMIAHTAEVAVIGRSLLLPIERALGTVHVQDDSLVQVRTIAWSTHSVSRCFSPFRFFSLTRTSVSNRLTVLVLAACFSNARHPTTACIAGSLASLAASLVSSYPAL